MGRDCFLGFACAFADFAVCGLLEEQNFIQVVLYSECFHLFNAYNVFD